jgi:large subunit ribosomal protein L17
MRHGKKIAHLGRTASHRKAMMANMASSLIEHKRINTTVAKAKALKKFVEPLITKAKSDTTHNRRVVFSALRNKYAVSELFRDIAEKVANRPGGYTRIIKVGSRMGDNASMAMIELVDFNDTYVTNKPAKKRSRRRGGKKKADAAAPAAVAAEATEEFTEEVVDNVTTEEVKEETPTTEAAADKEEKAEKAEKAEEAAPVEEVKSEKQEDDAKDSSASADQAEQNDEESKGDAAE